MAEHGWRRSDDRIWRQCNTAMFAVTNFCQAVSRRISVRRLQDRSVNADRRKTLCRLNLVVAVKPKHHNFQVKIALNEEDMNKLISTLQYSICFHFRCFNMYRCSIYIHCHLCAHFKVCLFISWERGYVLSRLSCVDFSLFQSFSWKIAATIHLRV